MNALTLRDVCVTYPSREESALDSVSLDLSAHAVHMIIGPNGSGKSSLLKSILGIIPYSGSITLSQDLQTSPYAFGYVPQRFSFDKSIPITVQELLRMTLITCKHTDNEKQALIHDSIASVDLASYHTRKLSSLSGGQLQRVLLARALIHSPRVLILDEPESGVDVKGERLFYELLVDIAKKKKMTVLIASHELDIVPEYADNVICLNRKVLCSGKPQTVLNNDVFEQLYGTGFKFYIHNNC